MAISWMQRLRLWLRGSQRRREERDREFLAKNAAWSAPTATAAANASTPARIRSTSIDREGLQAAYLDRSGLIAYYLDRETGEVVESRDAVLREPRYARVPEQSEDADRDAFLATLETPQRARLASAPSFRAALAEDRTLERAWYNFKNDRATAAIEEWLETVS